MVFVIFSYVKSIWGIMKVCWIILGFDHGVLPLDPADILAREQNKRPCVNFQRTGACQYGASCRYSHLTHEEVVRLQAVAGKYCLNIHVFFRIEPIQDPIQAILEVEALVRIRREKHLSSFLPWGYNLSELPPSVLRSLDNQPIQ